MKTSLIKIALLGGCLVPTLLQAQVGFNIREREIQIHGFLSEGFANSTANNYLRMNTSRGSFFTEAGLHVSTQITDRIHVGAQVYERDIGELGKGKVYLDWASADYRWKDWLGVRGGKVKTPLGLHNDTQDQEFLHTWALLPQSVYPVDLRAVSIAHVGGDLYGNISVKSGGSFSYTAFAGSITSDPRGGYLYGIEALGGKVTGDPKGKIAGIDLRWNSPISGLMVGSSLVYNHRSFTGTQGASPLPLSYSTKIDRVMAFYGQYTVGNFHADAEYRSQTRRAEITAEIPGRPVVRRPGSDERAWFISGAYRLSKWMEVGSYYSHYRVALINTVAPVTGPGRDHIYDKTVTARFDLTRFWDLKVEGHFMDGVGSPGNAHGFYPQDNPRGLLPTTNMLVLHRLVLLVRRLLTERTTRMKPAWELITVLIFSMVSTTAASDVKVIANSRVKVSQISPGELKRVFLATKTSLADGSHVVPVLLTSGSAYNAFLKEYIDKTTAGFENYYRSLVFTGKGAMPKMLGSDAEVLAYVKKTNGAIGYVSAGADTEGVKLLEVK